MFRVLVCGLPGSGKTSLASALQKPLNAAWFNADNVRAQFNDWCFDEEGRRRQSQRMRSLCDLAAMDGQQTAVCDFVAPTPCTRRLLDPQFVVFMDTIRQGRFEDTNKLFVPPTQADFVVSDLRDIPCRAEEVVAHIRLEVLKNL